MSTDSPSNSNPTIVSKATPSTTHLDPGATLSNRYRIVNHLGKGGMGEVYRADDLTLGVSVALKFLPPSLAQDPVRLEHFRSEVRLARQVSHPNVCRVYDIGETGGMSGEEPPRIFISMEYVDGEDLASLLRRIGRLPSDKAIQIARQLCFGLAAAHEQGIIHRDLKPANVMLDGRGQSRIMDFGIAGLSSNLLKSSVIAGTPGYMSPEQLSGSEVTKRSDIYSIGVLLYELFTGRPAFTASALEDLRAAQTSSARLTRPSTLIADLDPAVERIILQCLEPDPKDRPPSAMTVAAALPGGDPLAAALAAGETPSPELIAASGASGTLPPAKAWGRAAIIAAMLAAVVLITAPITLVSRVKPVKSPAVLEDRALEIIRALGYPDPPPESTTDSAKSLATRASHISYVNRTTSIRNKVERLSARPGAFDFWYRRSPSSIRSVSNDGGVQYQNPFPSQAGEIMVRLDSAGRLETFLALPPRTRSAAAVDTTDAAMKRLFEFADLDPSRFASIPPTVRSFIPTDNVQAWTGSLAELLDVPVRIHAGSIEGRINTFSVQYQYPQPSAPPAEVPEWKKNVLAGVSGTITYGAPVILMLILGATSYLAWRNLREGRGDRTTAFRLSIVVFLLILIVLFFSAHGLPSARSLFFDGEGIQPAIYGAIQIWLFYTALEPYARRVYPHALVSWTRLARGQVRDPLIGRHILTGMMFGATSILCTMLVTLAMRQFSPDARYISLFGGTGSYVGGHSGVAASVASSAVNSIMFGTGAMLPLVMGQLIFKRRWVGYLALVIALSALNGQGLLNNPLDAVIGTVVGLIPVLAIRPAGLLGLVATNLTIYIGLYLPVGLDWSHWFTAPVWIPAAILAATLVLAARSAAGARRFTPMARPTI